METFDRFDKLFLSILVSFFVLVLCLCAFVLYEELDLRKDISAGYKVFQLSEEKVSNDFLVYKNFVLYQRENFLGEKYFLAKMKDNEIKKLQRLDRNQYVMLTSLMKNGRENLKNQSINKNSKRLIREFIYALE